MLSKRHISSPVSRKLSDNSGIFGNGDLFDYQVHLSQRPDTILTLKYYTRTVASVMVLAFVVE